MQRNRSDSGNSFERCHKKISCEEILLLFIHDLMTVRDVRIMWEFNELLINLKLPEDAA